MITGQSLIIDGGKSTCVTILKKVANPAYQESNSAKFVEFIEIWI